MIYNKKDLKYYLECDKLALKIKKSRKFPRPYIDVIWKYQILLRKTEYFKNKKGKIPKILFNIYNVRLTLLGEKLGFSIGLNVFGPGLSIAHYGCTVVNGEAKIGNNCRIHEGVTIGSTNGSKEAAIIGDNCFIGTGAKIIGSVRIANNVAIGAGAVVVKDILEDNVSVAGVPAKVVSNKGSGKNVIRATEILKNDNM